MRELTKGVSRSEKPVTEDHDDTLPADPTMNEIAIAIFRDVAALEDTNEAIETLLLGIGHEKMPSKGDDAMPTGVMMVLSLIRSRTGRLRERLDDVRNKINDRPIPE